MLWLVLGCTSEQTVPTEPVIDIDEPKEETETEWREPTTRFAKKAVGFDVPNLTLGGGGPYAVAGASPTTGAWFLFDIDGDWIADLVHTADPGPSLRVLGGTADPHWDVYLGKGDGYKQTATTWALPNLVLGGTGFYAPNGLSTTTGAWALLDIDNDGMVDLVHTADPGPTLRVLGGPDDAHWDVYLNNGKRFVAAETRFEVPKLDFGGNGAFATGNATADRGSWSIIDMDADGLVDFVHHADRSQNLEVLGNNSPRWDVYRNNGSRFLKDAISWDVPDLSLGGSGLNALASTNVFSGSWSTFDIDGDGYVDMVHHANAGEGNTVLGGTGDPRWDVYENLGNAFALEPVAWELPPIDAGWEGLNGRAAASTYTGAWSTFDIDGDGMPDLVHTAEPSTPLTVLGESDGHWDVYRNRGVRFQDEPTRWELPQLRLGGSGPFFPFGMSTMAGSWATMDIDGDGAVDFVHTADPGTSMRVLGGAADGYWDVYYGE